MSVHSISKRLRESIVVQVSPYPPEPGADYHEMLARELAKEYGKPVIVLAGLNYLNVEEAMKRYGVVENHGDVMVYRAFWAPRIAEYRSLATILRYIVASLKALVQAIAIARKHAEKVVAHFHYGPTTWPGAFLGEHYPLGMILARLLGTRVLWTIHAFLTPYQLLQEAKERRIALPLSLLLIAYYLLLAKIAAKACHKIIVLVDSPNAPITKWLAKLLGKDKVEEQVHPPFKPLLKLITKSRDRIIIACLGYIRKEKGYHHLLKWLAELRNRDPELYNKVQVIIAGAIDRGKPQDITYLRELLEMKRKHQLANVEIIPRKLNREEFHKLLAESDIVWCAYEKKYGPSGILAWARAYGKRALYVGRLWGYNVGAVSSTQVCTHCVVEA